jgi:hypothetical protein
MGRSGFSKGDLAAKPEGGGAARIRSRRIVAEAKVSSGLPRSGHKKERGQIRPRSPSEEAKRRQEA